MAFCTYCGKELADGEVCSCRSGAAQNNAAQQSASYTADSMYAAPDPVVNAAQNTAQGEQNTAQGAQNTAQGEQNTAQGAPSESQGGEQRKSSFNLGKGFVNAFKLFPKTFTAPIDVTTQLYEDADLGTSVAAAILMFATFWVTPFIGTFYSLIRSSIYFGGINVLAITGRFVQNIFYPLIWAAVVAGAMYGVYALVNKLFIKGKMDIKKFAAFFTVPYAAVCCVNVLTWVNQLINADVFVLDIVIFALLAVAFIQMIVNLFKVIENKNKAVIAAVIAVGVYVFADRLISVLLNLTTNATGYYFFGMASLF